MAYVWYAQSLYFEAAMSINSSLVQGLVAGGAAVYLENRLRQEAAEMDAGSWSTVALQVNHLLLLTAETLLFAGCRMCAFKTFVQTAYVLTPLSLIAPLMGLVEPNLGVSPERAETWNQVYRLGVFTIAMYAWALGDPLFAAGSFSMLVIDGVASGMAHQAFVHLTKIPAFFALIGYGSQVFRSCLSCKTPEFLKVTAAVSTIFMGLKLCLIDPVVSLCKMLPESSSRERESSYGYPAYGGYHHYHHYSYEGLHSPSFSSSGSWGGSNFCRPSVW